MESKKRKSGEIEKDLKDLEVSKHRRIHDTVDEDIRTCAYKTHKRVEEMYRKGQTEIFNDERFIQLIFYEVLCKHFEIDELAKKGRIVLEFPAQALQGFKTKASGAPRELDIAIDRKKKLEADKNIPIAIEMKLAAKCYTPAKMPQIQSDLIRLSFLQQSKEVLGPSAKKSEKVSDKKSEKVAGPSAKKSEDKKGEKVAETSAKKSEKEAGRSSEIKVVPGPAEKCYFFMFGLKEELNGLYLPGFSEDYQKKKDKYKYGDEKSCWSLSVSDQCDSVMVKSVFLHPERVVKERLANEICIKMLADTTNNDFHSSFELKEDPKTFHTGIKAWTVCKPDPGKGFVDEGKK